MFYVKFQGDRAAASLSSLRSTACKYFNEVPNNNRIRVRFHDASLSILLQW